MSNDQQDNSRNDQRRVITPEVLGPEGNNQQESCKGNQWRRVTYIGNYGWPMTSVDQNACLAPVITLILFIVCLFQFGFLAALGFIFFHVLFGVLGSVQATSRLMTGEPFNIWLWRLGNWLFSFLLTIWLAGGFEN